MPIYLWKCFHCSIECSVIRKVTDIDLPPGEVNDDFVSDCKESGHHWERMLAATSFQLLGSGWFNKGGY